MTAPRRQPSRTSAFQHALRGLWYVLRTQHNARIHTAATFLVAGLGTWLRIDIRDWAILLLTVGTVWVAELFNTALEAMIDLVSPELHHLARVSKDISAAAVLAAAIIAILIGLLILGPPLLDRLIALEFSG